MTKRYVTTGAAAAYLGITRNTLHRWVSQGLVSPAFRTPNRGDMRWDLNDLDRQLHSRGEPMIDPTTPLHPAIVAAIVTSKQGVLVERRHDGKPLWTFPAGEAEPGEAPADTAIRETKEETGLQIVISHVIGEREHPKTGRHMIYLAARPYQGTAVHVGDEDELAEVKWVDLAKAKELLVGMYEPVHQHLAHILTD
jgi:8-oxo-dGTP diphosphatase